MGVQTAVLSRQRGQLVAGASGALEGAGHEVAGRPVGGQRGAV